MLLQNPEQTTALVVAVLAWAVLPAPILAILYAYGERQQQQNSQESPDSTVSGDE